MIHEILLFSPEIDLLLHYKNNKINNQIEYIFIVNMMIHKQPNNLFLGGKYAALS
jgi:hypothetical protein